MRHVQENPGFARLIVEDGAAEMFAEMAGRFSRRRPDEFGIDSAQHEQLKRKVIEWQKHGRSR